MPLTAAEVIRAVSGLTCRDRRLAAAVRGGEIVSEPTSMERALVDASAVLRQSGMPHALIGGLAVAVHTSLPRATIDVDFAVRSELDRDFVIAVFLAAGFTLRGRFEHSVNFLHGMGDPVQLAFDASFDEAIARAETHPLGGSTIRIVRREDLIALKERAATGPHGHRSKALRDQLDVELLRGDVPDPDEGW